MPIMRTPHSTTLAFDIEEIFIDSMSDTHARTMFSILSQEILPVDCSEESFLDRIDGQTCLGAIATDGTLEGQLLGVGVMDLRGPSQDVPFFNSAFFDLLATREDLKEGFGIGSAIARTAIERATDEGFSNIHGIIKNDSPTFHERFGYVEHPVNMPQGRVLFMVRAL